MTYTKEEQKKHRAELVKALRSGKYRQTQNSLRSGGSFCCLGVACDISGLGEWHIKEYLYIYLKKTERLPKEVMKYYGFKNIVGAFFRDGHKDSLMGLNDIGVSFEKIASIIEREPEGMFI